MLFCVDHDVIDIILVVLGPHWRRFGAVENRALLPIHDGDGRKLIGIDHTHTVGVSRSTVPEKTSVFEIALSDSWKQGKKVCKTTGKKHEGQF